MNSVSSSEGLLELGRGIDAVLAGRVLNVVDAESSSSGKLELRRVLDVELAGRGVDVVE